MAGIPYRPEIDGLRAIAVLSVVLYHVDATILPGGFVGVDVFFVISGYLITSLLATELGATGRIDLAAFYARRVKRLMPALVLVVAAVVAIYALLAMVSGAGIQDLVRSAVASLAFFPNIHFKGTTGGYFEPAADELPLLHLWSLGVEEQFYLLFPLLLWLLLSGGRRLAGAALFLSCLASLVLAEVWLRTDPESAFFLMPARLWELGAGALVALSPANGRLRGDGSVSAAAGLALIGLAAATTGVWLPFPGLGALPAVVGSVLVLYSVHVHPAADATHGAAAWLRWRPFVALGLLSYSWYLWHWPLLVLERKLNFAPAQLETRLLVALLALGLAWVSYRFVETPVRQSRRLPARRALLLGALAILGMIALLGGLDRRLQPAHREPTLAERTRMDRPQDQRRCHVYLKSEVESLDPGGCVQGSGSSPEFAVWGDSHALAWRPFARRLAEDAGAQFISVSMDSCPPVERYSGYRADIPTHARDCRRFNGRVLEFLATAAPQRIIIAARWTSYLAPGGVSPRPRDKAMSPEQFEAALDTVVSKLAGKQEVLLIAPVSELRRGAPECIESRREKECAYTRQEVLDSTAAARRLLLSVAARHSNVTVVDAMDFFCDGVSCPVTRDGYGLFWDDDHVSATAAAAFADRFLADPARYTLGAPSIMDPVNPREMPIDADE
ncbi:hypothetical protein N790_02565 [Arenimonas malthae CC-JY-1]|uniref:Acyltransferase 3 domain-containing protein n=1 Tax=Arenimonas malthae CC-JY-1 TaxID=1384054 RepID=A0A091AX73_9GAMM|nr:acyltransferase family protein [Arenimonas malthae]KFN43269.1 hypothetical protein N790_02565 [Arenimonas malthae CC-JY-1]